MNKAGCLSERQHPTIVAGSAYFRRGLPARGE